MFAIREYIQGQLWKKLLIFNEIFGNFSILFNELKKSNEKSEK